ncbi:MAG: PRD domain-containing protein [Erysipelotrichaceae bacterium]
MDFKERLDLYREGGLLNDEDIRDVESIIALFKDKYGMVLEEENADFFIAHISAAYNRNKSNEPVEELPEEVMNELLGLDTYEKSKEILSDILSCTHNPLSETERNYALLHINNLLANFKGNC